MKRPELTHMRPCVSAFSLADLPETLLFQICSLLTAQDLAALSVQDHYLRAVAVDAGLWQPLALARWPGAEAACEEHHAGDWHALYVSRAPLPHAFPLAADRVRAVTDAQRQRREQEQARARQAGAGTSAAGGAAAAGGMPGPLPQLAFEDVMRQTFAAGLACSRDRAVRQAPEWRRLKADLTWWAAERPEIAIAFIRGTHDALAGGHGGWGAAAAGRSWADTPWRRSAVAFLQDLGLLSGAHASVAARIAAEAAGLDRAIHSVQREASVDTAAPDGVPAAHWWFARA